MMNKNFSFTLAGVPELDRLLDRSLKEISRDIAKIPSADAVYSILLGGGYGRGEGGAFQEENGTMSLYNDLDFFVIVKDSAANQCASVDRELKCVSEKWSGILEIDVDFGPARSLSSLAKVRDTMMYQELKAGYRLVYGELDAMQTVPEADYRRIPRAEAMRLLLNRGAGLLFADEKIQSGKTDRKTLDFISRNLWKSVLGCGDAVLICANQYTAGVEKRADLLRQFSEAEYPGLADFYSRAVEFKRYPGLKPLPVLEDLWEQAVSLWIATLQELLFDSIALPKSPEEMTRRILSFSSWRDGNRLRNLLLNLDALRRGMFTGSFFLHPRHRLLAELYQILFAKNKKSEYIIGKRSTMSHELWFRLWNRFN